jgi:hypothetical protein
MAVVPSDIAQTFIRREATLGPVTSARHRRIAMIYAAMFILGLLPTIVGMSPALQAETNGRPCVVTLQTAASSLRMAAMTATLPGLTPARICFWYCRVRGCLGFGLSLGCDRLYDLFQNRKGRGVRGTFRGYCRGGTVSRRPRAISDTINGVTSSADGGFPTTLSTMALRASPEAPFFAMTRGMWLS